MNTRLKPSIARNISAKGHDYGIDLIMERFDTESGKHTSAQVYGELKEDDLRSIHQCIAEYFGLAK